MAEGWTRDILGNTVNIINSAGLRADGLNKLAVQVMNEVGVDISCQSSKKIKNINLDTFDLIVTLCDHANQTCPNIPHKSIIHRSILDPTLVSGNIEEQLVIYRKVRDDIKSLVIDLLKNYNKICQDRN